MIAIDTIVLMRYLVGDVASSSRLASTWPVPQIAFEEAGQTSVT